MSELKDLGFGETRPCYDEECEGTAELEVDGDHKFYVCDTCGFEFGHTKTDVVATGDDACAIGVPENLRRAASRAAERELAKDAPVTLGASIGLRPGL